MANAESKEDDEAHDSTDIGDIFGDEPKKDDDSGMEFVQQWQPSGQSGLREHLKEANKQAEKEELKADGLHGNGIISSTGMANAESKEDDEAHDSTDIGDIFGDEPKKDDDSGMEFVQQ